MTTVLNLRFWPLRRHTTARVARALLAGCVAALITFGLVTVPQTAHADTTPISAGVPETVSADPLPTWQLTGVVWSQVVVGDIVYATGNFTKARPPGMWGGGPLEIDVAHIFAYNITTGDRVASFNHTLNAQGLAITASPDGSRVYVGGDFTAVDGQVRQHVAAFDTMTGALVTSFAPYVNGQVKAMTATNSTLYVGGAFASVAGSARKFLASISTTNGQLNSWAPTADNGYVWALTMTPDQSKVVAGGQFSTLNGATVNGMGALDPVTGASLPWAANAVIKDSNKGAIDSLTTDGTYIYGAAYAFGTGGYFEGSFALNPADGSIRWMVDCLGDTYDIEPVGDVVYTTGHAHNCSMIGMFPDTVPRTRWQHANAYTSYPTGVNNGPDNYGWNYKNQPAPTMLHWYPDLMIGTASGQSQSAWSIVSGSGYVAYGGEFPKADGAKQQGLVRYALKGTATNKIGPKYTDTVPVRSAIPATTAVSISPGTVRVGYGTAWDPDNQRLKYQVYRDRGTAAEKLLKTSQIDTNFWTLPNQTLTDTGVPSGDHTYQVRITDPFGNELLSPVSETVSATTTASPYAAQVTIDGADHFWRLGDSGTTVYDSIADMDGTANSGITRGATGAIAGSSDKASTFSGTTSGYVALGTTTGAGPQTFTSEGWFKTTSTSGGKLINFGTAKTGNSSSYDRQVYMNNAGKLSFGVNPGGTKVVTSATGYNDGQWHMFTSLLGSAGMALYVDGRLVGQDRTVTGAQAFNGYWRIGGDTVGTWANSGTSGYLDATIDDVATYPTVLTPAQINDHYTKSGRTPTAPTTAPSDPYGADVFNGSPDVYWRLNETSGVVANDRGAADNRGLITGSPGYNAAGALTTASDPAMTFPNSATYVSSTSNFLAPGTYSEELWFKTNTTLGGKLIGWGNAATGVNTAIDRTVTLTNAGKVRFGALNGATKVTVDSPLSYNDNKWHYMVASQSPLGMQLFVDGVAVASDPNSNSSATTGFWRVGYDGSWGGNTNYSINGSIDEAAVYSRALSLAEIKARFRKGGGTVPNAAPAPSFTQSVTGGLNASFSGVGSTDSDGSIVSYSWNFGDGSAAVTTPTANHQYAASGTYQVTLTVTDNDGTSAAATQAISVTNGLPTADYATTTDFMTVNVDGTNSADTDGTIASYGWDFGDGTTGTGSTASHTYSTPGTYTIALTVTDNSGGTGTLSHTVTVTNTLPPVAAFTSVPAGLKVAFDGTGSSDPDGTVASYAWDFGDGQGSADPTPNHTYAAAGTYTATLTVTDNAGVTNAVSHDVTVANASPKASFTSTPTDLTVDFDGTGSSDPDGTVASYAWAFGDGTTGTGASPSHAYTTAGTYTVSLTVTDDGGATDTKTGPVTVKAANVKPTAAFTSSTTENVASLNAGTSTDPDGTIASYAWDFGDGTADGSGATTTHSFATNGTYQVKLTVTDNDGATDTLTKPVTITGPLAKDTFARTVATGWGSADIGGAWAYTGSTSLFAVANNTATMKLAAGSGPAARLPIASTDTDLNMTFSFDKAATGGGQFVRAVVRGDATNGYIGRVWAKADGTMVLYLSKVVAGTETDLGSKVLTTTYAANTAYTIRVQAWGSGTTNLRARMWKADANEPSTWSVSTTDTTAALQTAGGVAIRGYLSGSAANAPVSLQVSSLVAKPTGN